MENVENEYSNSTEKSASGEKKIVLPGELVFDSPRRQYGTYIENGKTYAAVISLLQDDRIVPLKGKYLPNPGDMVVGIVEEERFNGYTVDLNSPYSGQLSSRDLRDDYKVGDIMFVKIINVDEVNNAILADPRRLYGGEVLEVESVKIPRVIGRNMSMLNMLREYTGVDLFVGKNGRIYLKGANSAVAVEAILKIAREAHTTGLTDRVKEFLEQNKG